MIFMFSEVWESLAVRILEIQIENFKIQLIAINTYETWLFGQLWSLPQTQLIHHIFLWVSFIKKQLWLWFRFFSPLTHYMFLWELKILFSAEQKETSGIILLNVSHLIFSVNKCFVCLITCTCEADFSFSCDLTELKRDCAFCWGNNMMERLNKPRDRKGLLTPLHPVGHPGLRFVLRIFLVKNKPGPTDSGGINMSEVGWAQLSDLCKTSRSVQDQTLDLMLLEVFSNLRY